MKEIITQIEKTNISLVLLKSAIIIYSFKEHRFFLTNYLKSVFKNIDIDDDPYYEDVIDLLPIKKQELINKNIQEIKSGKLKSFEFTTEVFIDNDKQVINVRVLTDKENEYLYIYIKKNINPIIIEDNSSVINFFENVNNDKIADLEYYSKSNKLYYKNISKISLYAIFQDVNIWHYNFETKNLVIKNQLHKKFELNAENIREKLFYNISNEEFESIIYWINSSRESNKPSNYFFKFKPNNFQADNWKISYIFYYPTTLYDPEILICITKKIENITENLDELQETIKEIKLTESVKTHFLSHLSHELRTPLNILSGFSEILLNDKSNFLPEYNEAISFAGKSLLSQLNSISDYISILNNTYKVSPKEIDIWQLLYDLKSVFLKNYSGNARIMLVNNQDSTIIINDYDIIYSALYKIIENALNNTEDGYILIEYLVKDNNLNIIISDTGKGIKNRDINKIFLPFEKTDDFMPGVGLGLPTVKMIAKYIGADINIITEENIGTSITFSINNYEKIKSGYATIFSENIVDISKSNLPIYFFSNDKINSSYSLKNVLINYRIKYFKNKDKFEESLINDRPLLFIIDIENNEFLKEKIYDIIYKYNSNKKIIELHNNTIDNQHNNDDNKWVLYLKKPISIVKLKETILNCI